MMESFAIEPLTLSFEVACEPAHAFDTWTARFGTWWPRGHTASGHPAAEVVLDQLGLAEVEHNPRNNRMRAT